MSNSSTAFSGSSLSSLSQMSHLSREWRLTFGVINILICITAVIENLIVLFILIWYKNLHTLSNRILASLAVSDLLVGVAVAPLQSFQLMTKSDNECLHQIRRYLSTLLIGASTLTVGAISYDRYLHMTKLHNYNMHMSKRKIVIIILLSWLFPGCIPLLRLIGDSENTYGMMILSWVTMIFVTMIVCYILTLSALKKSIQWHKTYTHKESKQVHATKAVFILLTCYIIMVLPICIPHTLYLINREALSPENHEKMYLIVLTLAMFNSSVNPIIYVSRNPHFSENATKLLRGNFRRHVNRVNPKRDYHEMIRKHFPDYLIVSPLTGTPMTSLTPSPQLLQKGITAIHTALTVPVMS